MTKHDTFSAVVEKVSSIVGDDGLNLLINNAAVFLKPQNDESSFSKMAEVYETNVVSPLILTEALLPLLKKGSAVVSDKIYYLSNAAIVNVSSIGGSLQQQEAANLDQFKQFGFEMRNMYGYCCSKVKIKIIMVALNN